MSKSLMTLLEDGRLLPIVYSPDAFQSNLFGALDDFISKKTGLLPVYRSWFVHNQRSIELFYCDNVGKTAPNWHLVSQLFMHGPVLITLWAGDDPFLKFLNVKGKSHPNVADLNTIRSEFWCDNAICNLIHSSDNVSEAKRELEILKMLKTLKDTTESSIIPLFENQIVQGINIQHSGVIMLYRVILRYLKSVLKKDIQTIELSSSNSREVFSQVKHEILYLSNGKKNLEEFVSAYFRGNSNEVTQLDKLMPLFPWERFIIECGASTNSKWQ